MANRLNAADSSVLEPILQYLGPLVRRKLELRFRGVLSAEDLDDVVSTALYRLWVYRQEFDRTKAALSTWFYLIARSVAFDLLRRAKRRPLSLPDDWEIVAKSAEESHRGGIGTQARSDAHELTLALKGEIERLSEIDRRILLEFANARDENWVAPLTSELGMPASTIRSRKSRALAKLRNVLNEEWTGSTARGGRDVSGLQLQYREDDENESSTDLGPAPQPSFVLENQDRIRSVASGLSRLLDSRDDHRSASEAPFSSLWNEAVEHRDVSDANPRFLEDTYKWLKSVKDSRVEYLHCLSRFLERVSADSPFQSTSWARMPLAASVTRMEEVMSGISTKIELTMPDDVCRRGEGVVRIVWDNEGSGGPRLQWESTSDAPDIHLGSIVESCFVANGRLSREDANVLANALLLDMKFGRSIPLPNFRFPLDLEKGQATQTLNWKSPSISVDEVEAVDTPDWIQRREVVDLDLPSDLELDLHRDAPELAEQLDLLVCDAARTDGSRTRDTAPLEEEFAITALVSALAEQTGRTIADVAGLLAPALARGNSENSSDDCRMNKAAVAKLVSLLTT